MKVIHGGLSREGELPPPKVVMDEAIATIESLIEAIRSAASIEAEPAESFAIAADAQATLDANRAEWLIAVQGLSEELDISLRAEVALCAATTLLNSLDELFEPDDGEGEQAPVLRIA